MSALRFCCIVLQGHREEIVTMIANPAVDQVISTGYGNYRAYINLYRDV